jgi:uncharacterized protein (DUF433 family)
MTPFPRITRNPAVMGGKACIRGMRVTVGMILGNLGAGVTIERLLELYPYLEREDVLEAMRYGAWLASEREITFEAALEVCRRHEPLAGMDPSAEPARARCGALARHRCTRCADDDIIAWAAQEGRAVFTADLDFAAAIATRGLTAPDVVS